MSTAALLPVTHASVCMQVHRGDLIPCAGPSLHRLPEATSVTRGSTRQAIRPRTQARSVRDALEARGMTSMRAHERPGIENAKKSPYPRTPIRGLLADQLAATLKNHTQALPNHPGEWTPGQARGHGCGG